MPELTSALTAQIFRFFQSPSELSQKEVPPPYKQLFNNDVPGIMAKVGNGRAVTLNSEAYFRILAERRTEARIIEAQASPEPRVARVRKESGADDGVASIHADPVVEDHVASIHADPDVDDAAARARADSGMHDGYVTADESPPASPTLSRKISSASSYWSVAETPLQAAPLHAIVEEFDSTARVDTPVHEAAVPSSDAVAEDETAALPFDAFAEDDIAYADGDENTPMAEDNHQPADQAPRPLPRLKRSLLPVPQQDIHWLLGRAPAPPVLQSDDASAQSLQLAAQPATTAAVTAAPAAPAPTSVQTSAAAPVNPMHVFDFPKRAATQPAPWYSGIGGFVMAQLNRLVDGFKAVREMVYPAPAPSVSTSSREIAMTSLAIGRDAAVECAKQARAAEDMSAMRKLDFRTVTSLCDMFAGNPHKKEDDAKKAASNFISESKTCAKEMFQNTLTQAEQGQFWGEMELLMPFGNKLPNGLMEIATRPEPTDFAAYKKAVIDALDNYAATMNRLVKAPLA